MSSSSDFETPPPSPPPSPPPLPPIAGDDDDEELVLPPATDDLSLSEEEAVGEVQRVEQAEPKEEDGVKKWERPWSLGEVRDASKEWNLAADAGFLLYLKESSKRLVDRCQEIDKQFGALSVETEGTDVRANNVFNDFTMLSNVQFVENRIYEENEEDKEEEGEGQASGQQAGDEGDKPRGDEKRKAMVERIKKALKCGFDVLDNAFEEMEEEVVESPVEDMELSATVKPEVILQLRDPYAERSFPSLIGTEEFRQSERLGLMEYISDDDDDMSDSDDESDGQAPKGGELFDETASSGLETDSGGESEVDSAVGGDVGDGRRRVKSRSGGGSGLFDSSASSGTGLSDSEDEGGKANGETESGKQSGAPLDVTSELKKRFAGTEGGEEDDGLFDGEAEDKVAEPEEAEGGRKRSSSKRKKKKKKTKDSEQPVKPEKSDQLFDEDDESDGDLFGHKTGGLFEDDFSKVTSPPAAKNKDDGEADLFKQKGQSLFDDSDEEVEETPPKQPVTQPKPTASSKPMFGGSSGGGGLFDDDSDLGDDDLTPAASSKASQQEVSSGKPTANSLFEDEGDLFGASPPPPPSEGGDGHKKPVGGVSMFGGQSSALMNAVVKRQKSQASESDDHPPPSPRQPPAAKKNALFSSGGSMEADDDDLFGDTSPAKTTTQAPTKKDSPKTVKPPQPSAPKAALFDDEEEDDLFGDSKPKAPPVQTKPPKGKDTPPVEQKVKKPAGAVSLFGGIDVVSPTQPEAPSALFAEPDQPKTSKQTAPRTPEQSPKKERPVKDSPKVTKKPAANASLFDVGFEEDEKDDNLFASPPKATVKSAPKASLPPPTKKKDALFDFDDSDDDDLFSSMPRKKVVEKKAEAPAVKPSPKVEPKKKDSNVLFDSPSPPPEEDDLFAAITSSGKRSQQQQQQQTPPKPRKKDEDDLFASPSPPPSAPVETKPSRPSKYAPRVQPKEEEKAPIEPKPSPTIVTKPKKDALFDDDEDDDLFSAKPKASAPSAPGKRASFSSLFGDEGSASTKSGRSDGDLFQTARPQREPEKVVPVSRKPDVKEVKVEAVSVDPLGLLMGPSAVIIKPSPTVTTKPSPAVTAKPSLEVTAKPSPAVTTKPSPGSVRKPDANETEQKPVSTPKVDTKGPPQVATKPAKGPTHAYDEGSSDDDLFQDALSTLKPEPPKVVPKPSQTKTPVEERKSLEDSLTKSIPSSPGKKKPVGGVSLFGGVDLFGSGGKKEEDMFGDSPTSPSKVPPAVVPKPAKGSPSPSPASPKKSKQFTSSMTFDPRPHPPGASPPVQLERGASFEGPSNTQILTSVTKTRPRPQRTRPPSLKTTKGSVSSSHSVSTPDDIFSSSLTRSLDPAAAALTSSTKEGDIFASGSHTRSGEERKGRKKGKKDGAVASTVSVDVDGKGILPSASPKQSKKKKGGLQQGNEALLFGDTGDIFADLPSAPSKTKSGRPKKKKAQELPATRTAKKGEAAASHKEEPQPSTTSDQKEDVPFAEAEAPKKAATRKKKSTKKKLAAQGGDIDIFDTNTPSIFDSPAGV